MAIRLLSVAALLATAFANPAPEASSSTASENATATEISKPASTSQIKPNYEKPQQVGGSNSSSYGSPALVPLGDELVAALNQTLTALGTLAADLLPPYLSGSPMPGGTPWGSARNPAGPPPNTGVTRHYTFNVAATTRAPDGVTRDVILVNGQFPGPTIEANWGDYIEVVVNNQLADEGTSMHWHGLRQLDTPYMDGVPGVTQCPIAPGDSFTYRFRADQYGTSWWHSHYSAQYAAGINGPMIIYGPHDNADYDEDIGPVMLSDWYHESYFDLVEQTLAPTSENAPPPTSNNNLINGKMNYPCQDVNTTCTPNAGISKFNFQSGKSYRLRLINAGAEGIQKFSIDGYKLTIIANDFVPIKPYQVDVVTLGVGQRSDVVVKASGKPTDAVWMRSTLGPSVFVGGCTVNDGISPEAVAAIYYEKANTTALPTTNSTVPQSEIANCNNDPLSDTVPYYSAAAPSNPTTKVVNVTFGTNGTTNVFFMNSSSFRTDYNDPTLLEAKVGNLTFPPERNVVNFGEAQTILVHFVNYAITGAHPMHVHGHNMNVLAVGNGEWDGTVNNPSNPQQRDTQLMPTTGDVSQPFSNPGYMVASFAADNPGVWPFHCHIAWHVSGGLYINVLEKPNEIKNETQIPSIMAQTCRDWTTWTGDHVPDQIDSGL